MIRCECFAQDGGRHSLSCPFSGTDAPIGYVDVEIGERVRARPNGQVHVVAAFGDDGAGVVSLLCGVNGDDPDEWGYRRTEGLFATQPGDDVVSCRVCAARTKPESTT